MRALALLILTIVLPNGWIVRDPHGAMTMTDTMPQGAAASPDGKTLAVVESGFNPPTLRLYDRNLDQVASIPLKGAFGRPVWRDAGHVLVAGANADAILDIDTAAQTVRTIVLPKASWPSKIASADGNIVAVATDGDTSVRIGALDTLATVKAIRIGGLVGGLAFSPDGGTLFASNRSRDYVVALDVKTLRTRKIHTGLHPTDILPLGNRIYVAESDADSVGVYDGASGRPVAHIFVGDSFLQGQFAGVSPNALARNGNTIFVSLGAANAIGVIRDDRVVGRYDAGWYPTDIVPIGNRLYVIDGKGEGTRPNPHNSIAQKPGYNDYIGSIEYGSIRVIDLDAERPGAGNAQGALGWQRTRPDPIVRSDGPIKHVVFILKENRSYDQVLGDVHEGNGDPQLAWFGQRITPNEHALAKRFGLFDNTFASGEVSDAGHNWADSAFANDYVERSWPVIYGDRLDDDETLTGEGPGVPRNGYIWQAAVAAHVSFRDYGEATNVPSLRHLYDTRYPEFNLDISDLVRVKEWRREFDGFVRNGNLPQLEWMWLGNDHTFGSRVGKLTPKALVAQNDQAVGEIVSAISHSPMWRSTAIFIIEDDAQAGPDHVSDQRTTLFIASPYARGGVRSEHYSTVSVLRTIEIMLGMKPLSTYDAMAVPMYAAFTSNADMRPYDPIAALVNLNERNTKRSYGARLSSTLDFSAPDRISPSVLNDILAHNH